ncbi:MAG: hypothetical protein DRR06_15775 [Gammaproteobacteria bacterium]|nr:MAG: hypothetical protein DRR06_15775 [Gammaproteobacteria bacterium]
MKSMGHGRADIPLESVYRKVVKMGRGDRENSSQVKGHITKNKLYPINTRSHLKKDSVSKLAASIFVFLTLTFTLTFVVTELLVVLVGKFG